MRLRIRQNRARNISLAVSRFSKDHTVEIIKLCQSSGYDCVIIDDQVVAGDPASASRVVRITHEFIPEEYMPALLFLAQKGSMGASGDTAFARAFSGKYPMVLEAFPKSKKWPLGVYFSSRGYKLLSLWFETCRAGKYEELTSQMTPELEQEWLEFRSGPTRKMSSIWLRGSNVMYGAVFLLGEYRESKSEKPK